MPNKVIKYHHNEFIINWDESLCVNAKQCTKGLPVVFNRNLEPWIDLSKAEISEIKSTVAFCPSGALSYEYSDVEIPNDLLNWPKIQIMRNGPMVITGSFDLIKDGEPQKTYKMISLCRCGSSNNHPYCDGMHRKVGFSDDE